MDINAEVSTQLSLLDVLLSDIDKPAEAPCTSKKDEKKEEEVQDAMPDSTTNTEKNNSNPFHCGDDVLVPNKDGRYYLGTIVELSTSNDNDFCEVGAGVARCLVKFGDGTHSWAAVSSLKLLSAPPADDGRIMCVVCKQREGPTASPHPNAVIACDMCGRGYHAKCHSPPVDAWISGASWHCKRCVEQRYRVAAAENRALKRTDFFRFKGNQRRQQEEMTPPCDTASTTSSTASEAGNQQGESHCYCGEKSDWLAQMLLCCRCTRWFHQRCVKSLQYPLYAGDKLYIFSCSECNGPGAAEYLRRLELCWLDLAHLALYNLTAYNAPNYFDLDTVIMPYILDNWHVLQLPEKMWRTPVNERRERILTALTSSRKRFKCGREMKKRATIWGLRLRRPPQPPQQLAALEQIKKGVPLTDELVKEYAPRLRFLQRAAVTHTANNPNESTKTCNGNGDVSSYKFPSQRMIVPVDGNWLNLMMGKRFHENLTSNSNSENDSTSSYDSSKPHEASESPAPSISATPRKNAKEKIRKSTEKNQFDVDDNKNKNNQEEKPVPSQKSTLVQCSVNLNKISKEEIIRGKGTDIIDISSHTSKITTVNMEVSKLSTKNIIEHSKIMSLQNMDSSGPAYFNGLIPDLESSGDETSSRGTLDAIIPPLKDFQGKNNPFLMQNTYTASSKNVFKQTGKLNHHSRFSLPGQIYSQTGPLVKPLKRKLSEKDLVIGPNGEVKRRKYRRPKKYLLAQQLNKSCPQLNESSKPTDAPNDAANLGQDLNPRAEAKTKVHGRRLRQRSEKNYYENARRSNCTSNGNNSSVKSLQLSPHKVTSNSCQVVAEELSALKSSVQSYFRAGQTYQVLARRLTPTSSTAYLIQWDS